MVPCRLLLKCKWDTPGFREFHRRAQLFILFYIEAGSYIQVGTQCLWIDILSADNIASRKTRMNGNF